MRASDRFFLKFGDLVMIWLGLLLAVLVRTDFNWSRTLFYLEQQTWFFICLSGSVVLIFWLRGLYSRDWRYVGTEDAVDIAVTLFVVFVPFELLTLTAVGAAYPRTGLVVAYFPVLSFLAALRILIRHSLERRRRGEDGSRFVVVGSGDTVEVAIRELARSSSRPVGVVSLAPQKAALSIRGCPYLGSLEELPELVSKNQVDGLILAGLEPAQNAKVMAAAAELGVQLRTLPAVSDVLRGEVHVNTIRPLELEDLLEREPVTLDRQILGDYLSGQVILVTGAGGSIGAEITRQIVPFHPKRVILLGRGENSIHEILHELRQTFAHQLVSGEIDFSPYIADVRDRGSLDRAFELFKPTVVFHAAAHKHVPLMESQPVEACSNNILGTLNLMDCCSDHQVKHLVVLSTDKAVDPSSVMGATKRVTELLVHTHKRPGFTAVRFGNVLGSRGSVVPTLQKQIERGGPVTITDPEMSRYFMTIPEAVSLVLAAGAIADGGEIYVLEMGNPLKIVDLAENLVRLSGLVPHRDIEFVYSGARPGEKLSEELVYDQETSTPSKVKGMIRVSPKELPPDWPGESLENLKKAVRSGNEEQARKHLFDLLD